MIPKVIYMSYKSKIPDYIINNWKNLNPDYRIDFSLDDDCIDFLRNCNKISVQLFKEINQGMHKCDFWRLCKLYLHGGVYADVDLIPHVSIDSLLKEDATFYSCKSIVTNSIFQAFIITTPKNPILLSAILSFVQRRPYLMCDIGPTKDLYSVLKNNILRKPIVTNKLLTSSYCDVVIDFKTCNSYKYGSFNNDKIIIYLPVPVLFKQYKYELFTTPIDIIPQCEVLIKNDRRIVLIPKQYIACQNYTLFIRIFSDEKVYLFEEKSPYNKMLGCYISYKNKKIIDSRDENYYNCKKKNKEWA